MCKTRRERERAAAVMSGREPERGKGEREGQHGHQLAVAHLGQRRSLETMPGSSIPAAAISPSWRCARGGGWRGEALEWSGVEEFELGAACLNSRSPVHGGHGAGAGQRPRGLAVGLARGRLRCGLSKGQERGRGRRGASSAGGDGLAARCGLGRRGHGHVVSGAANSRVQGARCFVRRGKRRR